MYILRDYQQACVDAVREAYKTGYQAPLLVSPTGSGKTVMFSHIAEGVTQKNFRALIMVHRFGLMMQISEALGDFGILHGLINPKFRSNPLPPIQAGTVQAIGNRLKSLPKDAFNLIIIDEAHHSVADTWRGVVSHFHTAKLLGVTATPIRTDNQGLGRKAGGLFDHLVMGPSVGNLIARGYLKKFKVYAPKEYVDISDVKISKGDFDKTQLETKLNKGYVTGNAIEQYSRICPGVPAIAFCVSVRHAEMVAAQFCAAGITAAPVHGKMTDAEISARMKGLADGSIKVLTSCELISEGTDVPAVGCTIWLRPTNSLGFWLQGCGRGSRPYRDQEYNFVLDHAANTLRHGMPDEERVWSLDGTYKVPKPGSASAPKLVTCKSCGAITKYCNICPSCGSEHIHGSTVITAHGELAEISAEAVEALKVEKEYAPHPFRTLAEFEKIATDKKYKKGWAHYMFKNQKAKNPNAQ